MLLSRSVVLFLLLSVILLASEADARRRRRLKRQHDHGGDLDDDHEPRRARRRHLRRRRGRGSGTLPNSTLYTPVRHHDPEAMEGIPVGEAAVAQPRCPPPITPFFSELCAASACLHHHHCPPSTSCCFNGCVHTCLSQVVSPPVIDWLEDSSALVPMLEESAPPSLPIRYEDTNLAFAEGGGEAVHLPGGCTISGTQYSQLQDFMKAPSIEDCKCSEGEVVCAIKVFKS